MLHKAPTIYLYDDPSAKTLRIEEIAEYLKRLLGNIKVIVRGEFLNLFAKTSLDRLAEEIARTRIINLTKNDVENEPLPMEIQVEKRLILNPAKRLVGLFYDGFKLLKVYKELLPKEESDIRHYFHIVFTNRLFGTLDELDGRYHARVILCSFPSLISTTGIVEAPAKPREFYLLRRSLSAVDQSVPIEVLKDELKIDFINYDDERLTEVMKGYVLQAIAYQFFEDPFCSERYCRFYNAHWQDEVLKAQLSKLEFCERHLKMIKRWGEAFRLTRRDSHRSSKFDQCWNENIRR